ncbi:MAG TPA: carbon-nitrogen hydrolase family protein, partial [Candidatus Manganitrophaceae bacterium]|nr:carbon-nitrogen hydrolase family protein [Candidatus Manganitrophaceae bacterium]
MEKTNPLRKNVNRLTVAAIQMKAAPYQVQENLQKGEWLIEQAAQKGARIVALPELFNTGYCYDERNFKVGEDLSGPTARWLRNTAKRWRLYLAGGMIERDRKHFYNTLVLASPQGRLVSYRKRWLPLQEKCYFTKGNYPVLVDTPVGRIGIGICADMLDQKTWERFRNRASLLIISSAWPDFTTGGFLFSNTPVNFQISRMPHLLPKRLSASLGAPVIYANLCGPFDSPLPLLYPYHVNSRFVGGSAVYERGGIEAASLKDEEGVAAADVTVQPLQTREKYRVERGVRAMARLDR